MRSLILVAAALVALGHAREAAADSVAYTCSGAPNVKPILDGGACVGFIAYDDKKREVQRADKLTKLSGLILATADGSTVAMLQTFPLTDGGAKFGAMDALVFFRGGKVVAKYTMAELVVRLKLITETVSHVRWLVSTPDAKQLGKTLELTTSSMRKYSFDVATGKQLTADDTDDWKTCDVIAYLPETPPAPSGGVHTLPRVSFAKGTSALPLKVRADPGVAVSSGASLCIKAGVATKNLGVMFNTL